MQSSIQYQVRRSIRSYTTFVVLAGFCTVLLDVLALYVGFGLGTFLGLVGALVSDVRGFVAAIFLAILCLNGCALAELVARVLDDTVSSARDLNFGNLNSASEALG